MDIARPFQTVTNNARMEPESLEEEIVYPHDCRNIQTSGFVS